MPKPVVCVAGAGTAGLEALLCARELLGADVELRLIAPEREFRYRPMSTGSLYRPAAERSLAIADIVRDTDATWVRDRVVAVRLTERQIVTRDGETMPFDHLLLAIGGRTEPAVGCGHVWERGRDPGFLDEIITDIVAGRIATVALLIPRGAHWPVPAYELALVLGWTAAATRTRVTLITAERRPLGALGADATEVVGRELEDAGVELITGVEAIDALERDPGGVAIVSEPDTEADGDALRGRPSDPASIRLGAAPIRRFDRMISLPTASGPFLPGVPTDAAGFIQVDAGLKVCATECVWAVGACVSAGLAHGTLAACQADAAVAAIAAAVRGRDAADSPTPIAPDLTGMLLTGQREPWRAENPVGTPQPSTRCLWWPPGRAVGQMLARRIEAWDPSVADALPSNPTGVPITTPIALGCGPELPATDHEVTADLRAARLRDLENRQLMAVERRERAVDDELRALDAKLRAFRVRERKAISELKRHGYLWDPAA
jgi:sulfide:quinone oxidoreductase